KVLPTGRILVAEYQGQRVTERDRNGKVYWSIDLHDRPLTSYRLPNGNTFIATHSSTIEVTPERQTINLGYSDGRFLFCVQRLPNGRIVSIADPGLVQENEASTGRSLKTIRLGKEFSGWCGIEALTGGRYLTAFLHCGKVMEIDAAGKIIWECSIPGACSATRLANSHTIIADTMRMRLVEVDRSGKIVRQIATEGRPWKVRAN